MRKYTVLLIDDLWEEQQAFLTHAEQENIIITPFKTSKDGMDAFEEKLDIWDAVILDATVFLESEDEVASTRGMSASIRRITELSSERYVPYFVYTDQPDLLNNPLFGDMLEGKKYYNKVKDLSALLRDIKSMADKLPESQIRHKYADVFEAFSEEWIGDVGEEELLEILLSMEEKVPTLNPKTYFTQLRRILESMFRAANRIGLVHDKCIRNGNVNLADCSLFLTGKPLSRVRIKCAVSHFPPTIADNVRYLLTITNEASHTSEENPPEGKTMEISEEEMNTPYLLYGLTFIVCDVLVWYRQYADKNADVARNRSYWMNLSEEEANQWRNRPRRE